MCKQPITGGGLKLRSAAAQHPIPATDASCKSIEKKIMPFPVPIQMCFGLCYKSCNCQAQVCFAQKIS